MTSNTENAKPAAENPWAAAAAEASTSSMPISASVPASPMANVASTAIAAIEASLSSASIAGPPMGAVPPHVLAPVKRKRGRPRKTATNVASGTPGTPYSPAVPSGLRQCTTVADLEPRDQARGAAPKPVVVLDLAYMAEHDEMFAKIAAADAAAAAAAKAEGEMELDVVSLVGINGFTTLADVEAVHGAEVNRACFEFIHSTPRPFHASDLQEAGAQLVAPVLDTATLVTRIDHRLFGLGPIFPADVRTIRVEDYLAVEILDSARGVWRQVAVNPLELMPLSTEPVAGMEAAPMLSGQAGKKRGCEGEETGDASKRVRYE